MRVVTLFFQRKLSKEEAKALVFRIRKNECIIAAEVPHDLCEDLVFHVKNVSNNEIEQIIYKADNDGIISRLGLG